MLEVQRTYARKLIGSNVRVACVNGGVVEGNLMSFNGHSLWVVDGNEDQFVSIHDVIGLVPRAA
jgi:hypothetical protein